MAHLSKDFILFFQDLAANNNRDWFHDNKKRYEKAVKEPFKNFIGALIEAFKEVEPEVTMTAKEAIFRIHRDIRFSTDKTPYKMHASAAISTTSKKDYANPKGLYLEISPEFIRQYGGAYQPDKEQLQKIRMGIAANEGRFESIMQNNDFQAAYGTVRGEQHKRLPKEFKELHNRQPLVANKQFYIYTEMDVENVDSDQLIPMIIENYKIAQPFNYFLDEVMNG